MTSYEKSIDDVRNSRIYEYDSFDSLIKESGGTKDIDVFDCFHADWGSDGSPEDIAKNLRKSRMFKRKVPKW